MSKTRYHARKLKFVGEESFIVNDGRDRKYLMMTADPTIGKTLSPDVLVPTEETVNNPILPAVVVPETPVLLTFPKWETLSCEQIQTEIQNLQNTLMTSRFSQDVINQYQSQISLGQQTYASKCGRIEVPPPPPVIPEPDWKSLSCSQVKQKIADLEVLINTPGINAETAAVYSGYLSSGKMFYDTNCKLTTEPPPPPPPPPPSPTPGPGTTTITTTGTPIIATSGSGLISGGGLRGGGGGGLSVPEGATPVKKASDFQWWWLLVVAGGLYLLTRKGKSKS